MHQLVSGRAIKRAANVSCETCHLTTSKQCDVGPPYPARLGGRRGENPKKFFNVSRETPSAISACPHPKRIRRQAHPPKIPSHQKHCYSARRKCRLMFHVKQRLLSRRAFHNRQIVPPIQSKARQGRSARLSPKANVSRETFASRYTSHALRHSPPSIMQGGAPLKKALYVDCVHINKRSERKGRCNTGRKKERGRGGTLMFHVKHKPPS